MSVVSASRTLPLVALTAMNMLNYLDRYIVAALLPDMQRELHLSDWQGGLLGSAFMGVYFMVCPFFGWMGDRGKRPSWLSLGVALWSLATAATGLMVHFSTLLLARASVGVGEAAYGAIAPSLLADYFPKATRGRALSFFYVATPVGSALGFLLGGVLAQRIGWRHAFFCVGLPGLLLAAVARKLPDPPRGSLDASPGAAPVAAPTPAVSYAGMRKVYASLWHNQLYVLTVAGYTAYTFALGGMAFWAPSYMMRVRHYPQEQGMLLFGGITVVSGLLGTVIGGVAGDRLLKLTSRAYPLLNASSMLGAASCTALALTSSHNTGFLLWLSLAQLFIFISTGPVNALILSVVQAPMRATAMATCIFFIHLFGDAISPSLIGLVSDSAGLGPSMLAVPALYLVAGALWAYSARFAHPRFKI
jgi:MFS family permease